MYVLQRGLFKYYVCINDSLIDKVVITNSAISSSIYINYYEVLFIKIKLYIVYGLLFKIIRI